MTGAIIFILTYLVIGVQRLPWLKLDRPAGALAGAVAMVVFGVVSYGEALHEIGTEGMDVILFLLGMMVVIAYLEISGFFEVVEARVLRLARSARSLLYLVVASSGVLSAWFMNDTICLMLTPIVCRVTKRLGLPPAPYLIALATAANIGSSCTTLGNPQNALIAITSRIPLLPFLGALWPIAVIGLVLDAALIRWIYRRELTGAPLALPPVNHEKPVERGLLAWSLAAGIGMVAGLCAGVHPPAAAMVAGTAVILVGATRPRRALQQVDWLLLLFFAGLFVVMEGAEKAGITGAMLRLAGHLEAGDGSAMAHLGVSVTVLSQAISNVPAVMLFRPFLEGGTVAPEVATRLWLGLAAFSTLAGNLTVIGSVANIIVFESARKDGIEVGFFEYLRVGLPLTVATLAVAWVFLVYL